MRTLQQTHTGQKTPALGQIRGPLQVSFARSIDPVTPAEHAITRVAHTTAKDAEKKEKKRKELSSSRTKKFFRHFPQVDPEEHVINCESRESSLGIT